MLIDRRMFMTALLGPWLAKWFGWEPGRIDFARSLHARFAEDVTVFRAIYRPGTLAPLELPSNKKLCAFIEMPQELLEVDPAQIERQVRDDLTRAIQHKLFDGPAPTGYTNTP